MKTTITTVLLGLIALYSAASATEVLAQCAFERPTKASTSTTGRDVTSLVQAYVSCGNVGGNSPNDHYGIIFSCRPPETVNTQDGSPSSGWHFSAAPNTSWGRVRLERTSGAFVNPAGIRDLRIRVWLRHIVDGTNTAVGSVITPRFGSLQLLIRSTFDDPTTNHDMTIVDSPVVVSIKMVGGSATLSTTLAAVLAPIVGQRFPDCTSHEILSINVADENGTVFATSGVRINP